MPRHRIFLLSPAWCGGKRAKLVLNPRATFALAMAVRGEMGAPIGEVFAFLSGLYFRGKLAYVRRFAAAPRGMSGAYVITPTRGLVPIELPVRVADLRAFAKIDIHEDDPRYR